MTAKEARQGMALLIRAHQHEGNRIFRTFEELAQIEGVQCILMQCYLLIAVEEENDRKIKLEAKK
jgi:hypothetical protein